MLKSVPSSGQVSLTIECNPRSHYGEVLTTGLQGLTRVEPTDTIFQLPTWMDTPDDHQVEARGRLIRRTLSEMEAQMKAIKGEVLATEASKWITCGQAAKSSH